jgi:hypothetical protein
MNDAPFYRRRSGKQREGTRINILAGGDREELRRCPMLWERRREKHTTRKARNQIAWKFLFG